MRERFDASTARRGTGKRSSTDGRRRIRIAGVLRASSTRARCRSKATNGRYLKNKREVGPRRRVIDKSELVVPSAVGPLLFKAYTNLS